MWLRETGVDVSGVISLDPVSLSYLLEATGPVALPTGDVLTSENAVDLLLNGVYLRYADPRDQDAFFAAAAGSVFGALTSIEAPQLAAGLPTPYLGLWERINMGAGMLWIAVLAATLLRRHESMRDGARPRAQVARRA